jgi:2-polyprenyl-3-methyl-5-hydroxy-6-metoxy-1,4-benzoquinol methylase
MASTSRGGGRDVYWATYYSDVVAQGTPWLDHSNSRVQAQGFALALEAAGSLLGVRCLDVGCGWGQLTRLAWDLGARQAVGMDIVADLVNELRRKHPDQSWVCGSPADSHILSSLGGFDVVFAVEVLQYVPFGDAVRLLWSSVLPGGRLVVIVPNGSCPIVQKTQARFEQKYESPEPRDITEAIATLSDVAHFAIRGLAFGPDQRINPYFVAPWGDTGHEGMVPNRLQFVVVREEQQ